MSEEASTQHVEDHTATAIRVRLNRATRHSYLRDFVYGGVDGAVTTFAIVSGIAGAELSSGVIIVLGLANLVGDGFSMAASNYLASRAELQILENARCAETEHIRKYPDGEREEVRQILAAKGFVGDTLDSAVETITADEELWVNTMLQEELGLSLEKANPLKAASVTFAAFIVIGLLPLLSFLVSYLAPGSIAAPFETSVWLTGLAFFSVGAIKSRFVAGRWYLAGLETLSIGAIAAAIAYSIGAALRGIA